MDLSFERRIYGIVMDAPDQNPVLLSKYLDDACAGDERLRAEVEKRLKGFKEVLQNARQLKTLE